MAGPLHRSLGAPAWLIDAAERRLFPRIDVVMLLDAAHRPREVDDLVLDGVPARLAALDGQALGQAEERPTIVMIGDRPWLLSAAPVAATGMTLVAASRLDSRFLHDALEALPPNRVNLLVGADHTIYASTDQAHFLAGRALETPPADLTAGRALVDYGQGVPLTFLTLIPPGEIAATVRPLLQLDRSQRTLMATTMSGLFLAVLAWLAFRVRQVIGQVARVTDDIFGVQAETVRGGDELVALHREVERLGAAVRESREALKAEAAERLRLRERQLVVQAEMDRLAQLQAVTDLLGVGVLVLGEDGPVCRNGVMRRLVARLGGAEPLLAARARGEDEVRVGSEIFAVTLARQVDPGMILVEDVTARRQAEEAVASFALFPAQDPFPVLRLDADGQVVHANDASMPLLRHWQAGFGRRVPEPWVERIGAALADGSTRDFEETVGSRVLSLVMVPLRESGYVNLYGSDVTDRVIAERQLQAFAGWLEDRVADRTRALEQAKDQAELASRSKSEFLAIVSHELRTPLNAIIGFSEVMITGLFGPLGNDRYRDYITAILDSGRHLLDVINDILDVSKIEAGRVGLMLESVAIDEVVAAALRLVEGRARAGGLELSAAVPAGLPPVHADRRRLLQILINLLSNAVKFTPAGGQAAIAAAIEGGDLVLTIRDTGIGMDAAEIAVALEPFRQVDGRLARRYQGTGLGLPLAKSLTELHGGSLDIASAKHQGTTVTVRIPSRPAARSAA